MTQLTELFDFLDQIPDPVSHNEPFYFFGAGEAGEFCVNLLKGRGLLQGFLDETPEKMGKKLNGYTIYDPKEVLGNNADTMVYATVFRSDIDLKILCDQLSKKYHAQFHPFLELFSCYLDRNYYFFSPRGDFSQVKKNAAALYATLATEQSREKLLRHLKFRYSYDVEHLSEPDLPRFNELKYFDEPVNFIDVGAFDGDTIRDIQKTALQIENIYAFEPDPRNFEKLKKFVVDKRIKNCSLFDIAISDKTAETYIQSSGNESSKISDSGVRVHTKKLDDVIKKNNHFLDIIKYDTEGYELECLQGSMGYIKANRPILMVSLYHYPNDIFELPPLLARELSEYKFDLIESGYSGTDLMLYAYPDHLDIFQ